MGISDDIIKQIEAALGKGINPKNLSITARKTANSIKKRTRLGKGVKQDGAKLNKLDPLTPTYKKQRKKLKLSSDTTPAKSNLTKSGSMLNDIKTKTTSSGFEIFFGSDKNKEKAEGLGKKRPFFFISSFELKLIIEDILSRITRGK